MLRKLNEKRRKSHNNGFTVVELSVYVALISIAGAVIVSFFAHSQRLTSRTQQNQETTTKILDGLTWITRDIRSASRTELGSLLLNGTFEEKTDDTTASYWNTTVTGNGLYTYDHSSDTMTVHMGQRSLFLKSNDGNSVSLSSTKFMKFNDGMAYMLTGWVRTGDASSVGKITLVDDNGNVLVSTQSSSQVWQKLMVRYPANSTYVSSTINNDKAKIQLAVTGNNNAYFDDLSVSHLHAVLASENTSEINITNTASDLNDPGESTGFRFTRWVDNTSTLFRYRVVKTNDKNQLVREIYRSSSGMWEQSGPLQLFEGFDTLSFSYDANFSLPENGKQSPLQISMSMPVSDLTNTAKSKIQNISVLPMGP